MYVAASGNRSCQQLPEHKMNKKSLNFSDFFIYPKSKVENIRAC